MYVNAMQLRVSFTLGAGQREVIYTLSPHNRDNLQRLTRRLFKLSPCNVTLKKFRAEVVAAAPVDTFLKLNVRR